MMSLYRKLFFGLLVLSCLMSVSFVFGQSGSRNKLTIKQFHGKKVPASLLKKTVVKVDNESAKNVLIAMAEKNNLNLSYNVSNLQLDKKVSLNLIDVYVLEGLLAVTEEIGAQLQITKNGNLTILPKKQELKKKKIINGQINGFVLDSNDGSPLVGANVVIKGTSKGAATDLEGKFELPPIAPGNYILEVSYIGYKSKDVKVDLKEGEKKNILVNLEWVAVEGETIEVSVQAKGQLAAINEQLAADEIKNVVSKDRIRELPDNNAAESVGRLPGVALIRTGGEGDKVIIRGLQPKYSKIMVDGIALTPTGRTDRSMSMNMISSYSLEGIEVIKSPTANMDGDQVAGSVNFKIKTAPKGLQYSVIAEGGYNDLKNTYSDYLIAGDVSNRFYDNKLGAYLQLTVDKKNLASNQMSASYEVISPQIDKKNDLETLDLGLKDIYRTRKRYGATFTVDYNIPQGKIYLKNFYSKSDNDYQKYTETFSNSRSHRYYTENKPFDQEIYSNIFNYDQNFSGFNIHSKLSHSYSGTNSPQNIDYVFVNLQDLETFPRSTPPGEIQDYAKNDLDNTVWDRVKLTDGITKGRQLTASLDLEKDFSITKSINGKISIGGKYKYQDHSYDLEGYGGYLYPLGGHEIKDSILTAFPWMQQYAPLGTFHFPYEIFMDKDFSHGDFLDGRYTMGPVANIDLMYDVVKVMKKTYDGLDDLHKSGFYTYLHKSSVTYDYSGHENLSAGYIMLNLNLTDKIKFIPGVRYEKNRTEYTGTRGFTDQYSELDYPHEDTTRVRNNDFWLPMIHLRYMPSKHIQVRLAYTKTLARPNYTYLVPRLDLGRDYISTNSPWLKPELAESFDINLTFSGNYIGLFSVSGYWKNIKDKIYSTGQRILKDPAKYDIPDIYLGRDFAAQENIKDISTVKGFELDWQTNFWYLPFYLNGLVLNINYTKIFSKTKYPKTEYKSRLISEAPWVVYDEIDRSYWDRMQNQPNDILNVSLGYDYKGFSGRVSMFYQSDIFIHSSFWEEERILTDDYLRWDLSVKQKLPWKGLEIYGNVVNLNSALDKDYIDGNNQPTSMEMYGMLIRLGLRYRFE